MMKATRLLLSLSGTFLLLFSPFPASATEHSSGAEDLFQGWDLEGVARDLAAHPKFHEYYMRAREELQTQNRENVSGKSPAPLISEPLTAITPEKTKVELFFSLTCSHCWRAWERLRADDSAMLKSKGGGIDFKVKTLVSSKAEGILGLIFDTLQYREPEKAFKFLDFLSSHRYRFKSSDFVQVLDRWLVEHEEGGYAVFGSRIKSEDRERLASYGKIFERYGGRMTPSIYVNGVKNNAFFDDVRTRHE